jgi:glycosyltransferase involved in cell wall biosynthesis
VKIAFLSWRDLAHPQAGGCEVLVDSLARGLVGRGHEVTLICGGPVSERTYRVIDAGGRFSHYVRAPIAAMRQCRDADLVVDVSNGMSYLAPLWRRKPSVCVVNHVHTAQWSQWFNPALAGIGRALESRAMPWAYRHRLFIAVSPSTAEGLTRIGVRPDQIRVVTPGVEAPVVRARKSAEPLFVAVSRLVPHKRFDLLFSVWDSVRTQTGGRLVIVGDGPEAARLQSMAGPGVEFAGYLSEHDKQRVLAEAWLLVHPSMHEGWGLVITEAGAAGTCAIGFDAPGVRDAIADGESGVLVSTPAEMAAAWVALAGDPQRRAALDNGARRRAARFSEVATVDRFLEVAHEAVGGSTRTAPVRARPQVVQTPTPSSQPTAPYVSIIVPAYNEAARLPDSLPALAAAARSFDGELIVVDDGSTDTTSAVATDLLRDVRDSSVLRLPVQQGKGAAVRAGVAHATGRRILFVDADGATHLSHLDEVLAALDHAHVAIGSRGVPGSVASGATWARAVMGRSFNRWARVVSGADLRDFQCGFKAFRSPVAKLLFDLSRVDGYAFDVEVLGLAHRIGYRTVEIPVTWHAVPGGHVRPFRDAPVMAGSVLCTRLRWTGSRSLTAIRAASRGRIDAEQAAAALAALLPGSGPVVPWREGALALMPFVDDALAARFAAQVQAGLPDFAVHSDRMAARLLLARSGLDLRRAIAAA